MRATLILCLAVCLLAMPAAADWKVGDPHKMHYPQLPDPNGWDVKASYYLFLADDWQCSESGPVKDIHLWVSFYDDVQFTLTQIHTAIWTDDTSGTYSKPKDRVWHKDWDSGWTIVHYETGLQGWFDPRVPAQHELEEHTKTYQINLLIPPTEAFQQVKDTVYWLEVSFQPIESLIGWKTSKSPHFRDDAVWRTEVDPWAELRDPVTQQTLDLAFVITPEPGTLVLLGFGGLAVIGGLARAFRRQV